MVLTLSQVHVSVSSNDTVQVIAAVATAAAAVATAWMAWKTRTLARETKEVACATAREAKAVEDQGEHIAEQAKATAGALKAAVLPWLTWEPSHELPPPAGTLGKLGMAQTPGGALAIPESHSGVEILDDNAGLRGQILVKNVGPGIALIDKNESWVYGAGADPQRFVTISADKPVLPSGESARLLFAIDTTSAAWTGMNVDKFSGRPQTNGSFSVDIVYTDVAKVSRWRARLCIVSVEGRDWWVVHRIEYYEGNSEEADFVVLVQAHERR